MDSEEEMDKEKKGALRHNQPVDVPELERRVHVAELRAREVEAELRYLEASDKRRALKAERKDKKNKGGKSMHGGRKAKESQA